MPGVRVEYPARPRHYSTYSPASQRFGEPRRKMSNTPGSKASHTVQRRQIRRALCPFPIMSSMYVQRWANQTESGVNRRPDGDLSNRLLLQCFYTLINIIFSHNLLFKKMRQENTSYNKFFCEFYLTQLYTQICLRELSKEMLECFCFCFFFVFPWQLTGWQPLVNIWPSADCVNLQTAEKSSSCRRCGQSPGRTATNVADSCGSVIEN